MRLLSCVFTLTVLAAVPVQAEKAPVSVIDFGAVADGKTNSTAAFHKALETARDVYVPPGRFLIDNLTLPDESFFTGPGTIILGKGSNIHVGNRCRIADLRFTGREKFDKVHEDAMAAAILQLGPSTDISIDNVRMEDYRNTGISTDHATDVRITNSHFEKLNSAIQIQFSRRIVVSGNRVVDIGRHGIQFWGNWKFEVKGCEDLIFRDNYVKNGGGGAIRGTGATRVVYANNIIDGAQDVGLDLEWCDDCTVTGNTVRNGENAGISLFFSCHRVSITGNTVINDRKITDPNPGWYVRAGIWLTNTNRSQFKNDLGHRDITIVGNTVYSPEGRRRAIWIGTGSENITIANNVFDGGECKGCEELRPDPLKIVRIKPAAGP